jgi:hypothetical protein
MGTSPVLTAPDIYHTACPYPVELPDDLRRQEVYEEDLNLDLEMPEAPIEGIPAPLLEDEPNVQNPPEPYNPPARPMTEVRPASQPKVRLALDDSLTPPAPPRD